MPADSRDAGAPADERPTVRVERRDAAQWITIDRPERRNALDDGVAVGIAEGLRAAHADPAIRAIVLTGAGDRAFCAGGDLRAGEGDSPFDYDVITSSQDGCPLRDVIVSPEGDKGGVSVVAVRFRLWACSSDAESQAKINELKFDVVTEGGKPVIADIHRLQDGRWDTLVGEMEETVRLGQARQ